MTMTILHAGGTADTGVLLGQARETTNYAISGISRGTIQVPTGSYYQINCTNPANGTPTTYTKGWLHFNIGHDQYSTGGYPMQQWLGANGVAFLRMFTTGGRRTDFLFVAQYYNGTAWVDIDGTANKFISDGQRTIDYFTDFSTGTMAMYVNGVVVFNITNPALVNLGAVASVMLTNAGDYAHYYQQTLIATGEPTIGCNVRTRYATAAGDDTAWAGSFADVDEFPYNDDDYISAANIGDRESFVANNLAALPVGNEVKGVVIAARFRTNGGTPANVRPFLSINGLRYPTSNFPKASVGWTGGWSVYPVNPATGAAWGKDINTVNVQFGIEATE